MIDHMLGSVTVARVKLRPGQLADLMRKRGVSGYWLAQYIGVSRSSVSAWKMGDRHPTPEHFYKLCQALK